jgi:hypothetical protein
VRCASAYALCSACGNVRYATAAKDKIGWGRGGETRWIHVLERGADTE